MAEREARPIYIRRSLVRTGLLTGIIGGIAFAGAGAWDPASVLYSIGLLFLATSGMTLVGTFLSWFLPGARQEAEMVQKLEQLAEAEEMAAVEAEAEASLEASLPPLAELPTAPWTPRSQGLGGTPVYEASSSGGPRPEPTVYMPRSEPPRVEPTVYVSRAQQEPEPPAPASPPPPHAAPARRQVQREVEMIERMGTVKPGDSEGLVRALRQFGSREEPPRRR